MTKCTDLQASSNPGVGPARPYIHLGARGLYPSPLLSMDAATHQNTKWMPYWIALSQILGIAALAVTGTWLSHYRGGFAWSGNLQFNVHPLCMVLGMVFLCGDALLVYRVFRNETKKATKILHGVLHIFALIISLVGIIAVFQFHKTNSIPDMYSLHSWCGIATFTLYILQWILGFVLFFIPGVAYTYRTQFKPLHVFFGICLLICSIASCLIGLTEKMLFSIPFLVEFTIKVCIEGRFRKEGKIFHIYLTSHMYRQENNEQANTAEMKKKKENPEVL
uniref:Transmembrane ascorbate-dependent reductase CYB561 n=1 Tax=Leptobrachium leishanense TaxID=445787 RepID=A0A8C5PZ96_9ANUR